MARRHRDDWVFESILQWLSSGTWQEGDRVPPTRQLAQQMGVSHVTAQSAVRKAARQKLLKVQQRRPVTVLPAARERAERLLDRLTKRSQAAKVAILVPEVYLPKGDRPEAYYRALSNHLAREGRQRNLLASVVKWPLNDQIPAVMSLRHQGYKAAVFIGFNADFLPSVMLLHEQTFPLLIFNRIIPGLKLPTIRLADYAAAQRIADHFTSRGHRNLCMVTHCGARGRLDRVAGWSRYLIDNGLLDACIIPIYLSPWSRGLPLYDRAFVRLLHSRERPTAILFAAGPWARDFMADERFADLKVPDDISLATFEPVGGIAAVPWSPTLTSICTHFGRTAECVFEQVEKMLDGEMLPPSIRVPMDIALTGSIGEVPRAATT